MLAQMMAPSQHWAAVQQQNEKPDILPLALAMRGGQTSPQTPMARMMAGAPEMRTAMSLVPGVGDSTGHVTWSGEVPDGFRDGIIQTAAALNIAPEDLATVISYETAGTFNPMQAGPTTQWGQHRGLIQFGEPQARQFGVDFSSPEAAAASQFGADGAIVKYLTAHGFQPGMGLMDLYSTINAGRPGRYGASDANNGGAPGTVADKVNNQMAGHRANALALLGL